MCFPSFDGLLNFLGRLPRAHFPNKRAIGWKHRHQTVQIDLSGERGLMILGRPNAVLHMTAESAWSDLLEPLCVVEKLEVRFDLDVAEVVPVTKLRRVHFV